MLEHFAETIPPQGTMGAHGYRNLLGRPAGLSPIDIMVRETVQNSWDARRYGQRPSCNFAVRLVDAAVLKELLGIASGRAELESLESLVKAIEISDYSTTGLGGPIRADHAHKAGDNTNYVDFVLNFGVPPSTPGGAGTYGFGRSILYRASKNGLIAIYSRTIVENGYENRFTLAALWEAKGIETGRHWFGKVYSEPNRPAPLLNSEADEIAVRLGFQCRSDDMTGTSILVINPVVSLEREQEDLDLSVEEIESKIIISVYEHCWPKLVGVPEVKESEMKIKVGGQELCPPREIPALMPFVEAFFAVNGDKDILNVTPISGPAEVGTVGSAAVCDYVGASYKSTSLPAEVWSYFENWNKLNTVALMRAPNLIVKYFGDGSTIDGRYWGGVFKVVNDNTVDRAFAAAEPPTHDDWEAKNVTGEKRQKTIVKLALRGLNEYLRKRNPQTQPILGDASSVSVSNALANVLPFDYSFLHMKKLEPVPEGAGKGKSKVSNKEGKSNQSDKFVTGPSFAIIGNELIEENQCIISKVFIKVEGEGEKPWSLNPMSTVLLEDGSIESEAPMGAEQPRILQWTDGITVGETEIITSSGVKTLVIKVEIFEDVRVALNPVVVYV